MAEEKKKNLKILHILAEIGIVTIGILIAYQLNNWKEVRSTQTEEKKILQEIKSNLELDLSDLQGNHDGHKRALALFDSLGMFAESSEYNPKIPMFIRNCFRDFIFLPQTSAFETLRSKGVTLINNDSLRIKILRLYDFDYVLLVKIESEFAPSQFNADYRYIVENYFLDFDLLDDEKIKPRFDNSKWLNNSDVKVRRDMVRNERIFDLKIYKGVIESVNDLIKELDKEIENEF